MNLEKLSVVDPELKGYIDAELNRQRDKIELIASENIVTPAVMEAMGSVLTNKYAEGYPGHRYYGGCEYVDKVETLAIERAKKLFHAEYANVQAHCGASTNMTVYFAFLKPGDTIMGMDLSQGGHLSHGSPVNISGTYFNVVHYGVNPETELIDYDVQLTGVGCQCYVVRQMGLTDLADYPLYHRFHSSVFLLEEREELFAARIIGKWPKPFAASPGKQYQLHNLEC